VTPVKASVQLAGFLDSNLRRNEETMSSFFRARNNGAII